MLGEGQEALREGADEVLDVTFGYPQMGSAGTGAKVGSGGDNNKSQPSRSTKVDRESVSTCKLDHHGIH